MSQSGEAKPAQRERADVDLKKLRFLHKPQLLLEPEVRNDLQPFLCTIHYSSRLTPHANTQTSPQHGIDPALLKLLDSTRTTISVEEPRLRMSPFVFSSKSLIGGCPCHVTNNSLNSGRWLVNAVSLLPSNKLLLQCLAGPEVTKVPHSRRLIASHFRCVEQWEIKKKGEQRISNQRDIAVRIRALSDPAAHQSTCRIRVHPFPETHHGLMSHDCAPPLGTCRWHCGAAGLEPQ
ncbi:hypothetical protein MHYP_G00024910 [Metynnis hypsauchen]